MALYTQTITCQIDAGGPRVSPERLLRTLWERGRVYSDGFALIGQGALAGVTLVIPHLSGQVTGADPPHTASLRFNKLPRDEQREQEAIARKLLVQGNQLTIQTTDYTCYARMSHLVERMWALENPNEILVP